ncbi:FliM/FliN family flagellar motor switch protein [Yersinia sp. J1]|uniref:FliM/FliN family flagellar motor switch protein n=1 Tax=Yersinia sp. J1 TaxID=3424774 RepID=UPI003D36339B
MIGRYFRQISQEQLVWSRVAEHWERQGIDVSFTIPPQNVCLVSFATDAGWEGLLDLRNWFMQMMPEQAGLATSAFTNEQIKNLFIGCSQPINMALPEFSYQSMQDIEMVEDNKLFNTPLYAIDTDRGRVWLTKFVHESVNIPAKNQRTDLSHLPLPICFEIGSSKGSLRLLNKLICGDVLLITDVRQQVTIHGKHIRYYQRNGDEIMLEEAMSDMPVENKSQDNQSDGSHDQEISMGLSPRSQMPVRLTFTLQQTQVTVEELELLYKGHIFTCDPDAEKKIIISGNGLALARGELVWIEDRLGVEITEIYHEAGNGK